MVWCGAAWCSVVRCAVKILLCFKRCMMLSLGLYDKLIENLTSDCAGSTPVSVCFPHACVLQACFEV